MNRGVEIAPEVAALPRSVVTKQVANGVAVRMAVLFRLLASGEALSSGVLIRGGEVVDATGRRRGRRAGR